MNKLAFVCTLLVVFAAAPRLFAAEAPASSQPATTQPSETLEATQTEQLTAAKDKVVAVKGTVSRVGWSPRGNILFINFEGVGRDGFTAVVPKDNKEAVAKYGEDGAELMGKSVEITGTIIMYKGRTGPEKPEIEIKNADQIKVTGEAATKPAEPPAQ